MRTQSADHAKYSWAQRVTYLQLEEENGHVRGIEPSAEEAEDGGHAEAIDNVEVCTGLGREVTPSEERRAHEPKDCGCDKEHAYRPRVCDHPPGPEPDGHGHEDPGQQDERVELMRSSLQEDGISDGQHVSFGTMRAGSFPRCRARAIGGGGGGLLSRRQHLSWSHCAARTALRVQVLLSRSGRHHGGCAAASLSGYATSKSLKSS